MDEHLAEEVTMEGNSLHIIEAKTGSLIPVLNDHNLHSTLDPMKEAIDSIESKVNQVIDQENILVLGLGFAYHIEAIRKINPNAKIWIVEPNRELIDAYINKFINPVNATILCEQDIEKIYSNHKFVSVLLKKPYIYTHRNSIEANQKYFRSFLNYQASKFCSDYLSQIDFEIRGYLENEIDNNEDLTLYSLIEQKKQAKNLSSHDHLILALDSLLQA